MSDEIIMIPLMQIGNRLPMKLKICDSARNGCDRNRCLLIPEAKQWKCLRSVKSYELLFNEQFSNSVLFKFKKSSWNTSPRAFCFK